MEERSDAALMEMTAQGDNMAFKAIYSRYEYRIFNFILRMTGQRELAQDLIQETFVRLWSTAHMYDPRRGTLKTWLYKMALNIVRSEMVKKVHAHSFEPIDDLRHSVPGGDDPAQRLEEQRAGQQIRRAVEGLSPHLREVIVLKYYQNMMFREISEITGHPEGTIKARFHRAVSQLKKDYALEGETP